MIEVLEFIFRDPWTFAGVILLIAVLGSWFPIVQIDQSTKILHKKEDVEP